MRKAPGEELAPFAWRTGYRWFPPGPLGGAVVPLCGVVGVAVVPCGTVVVPVVEAPGLACGADDPEGVPLTGAPDVPAVPGVAMPPAGAVPGVGAATVDSGTGGAAPGERIVRPW